VLRRLLTFLANRRPRPTAEPCGPHRAAGLRAEEAAARTLERLGYRVRARNVRFRFGELDLVCQHGQTLVFVEVKARAAPHHGAPVEAVTSQKQRQLVRLAQVYLQTLREGPPPCRFDVVAVDLTPDGRPARVEVVVDAFRADDELSGKAGRIPRCWRGAPYRRV